MDWGTRIVAAVVGGIVPSLVSVFILFAFFVFALFTTPVGGGEMGPGLAIPFVLLGLIALAIILWGISTLILLGAGFSWKLLWWITGIMGGLCFLISLVLYKGW
ncbi:MAG: hypothetical protein IKP96_06480 [Elusimicrobiaceae bacterium]|nr:hypothetical protein [Elusimicrobiaceae bacterium]